VFPVSRRVAGGGGCRRDGGDSAGRLVARRGGYRRRGRKGHGDGLHRSAPFPALRGGLDEKPAGGGFLAKGVAKVSGELYRQPLSQPLSDRAFFDKGIDKVCD